MVHIYIQMLELSETYSPEVSDYRQGRITQINASREITIEIIGKQLSYI